LRLYAYSVGGNRGGVTVSVANAKPQATRMRDRGSVI